VRYRKGVTDPLEAVGATTGHFRYESGHHGDLWLDLDGLLVDARRTNEWARQLAEQAAACNPDVVCGPLTGGAFVAQLVALELGTRFMFADAASYRIPATLHATVDGARVLLVDDAINAGSAINATLADLLRHGARLAGLASLLTLGPAAERIAREHQAPQYALAALQRNMWEPEACPLCRQGAPLDGGAP
jgi:orotate phosphoribosyltransferase